MAEDLIAQRLDSAPVARHAYTPPKCITCDAYAMECISLVIEHDLTSKVGSGSEWLRKTFGAPKWQGVSRPSFRWNTLEAHSLRIQMNGNLRKRGREGDNSTETAGNVKSAPIGALVNRFEADDYLTINPYIMGYFRNRYSVSKSFASVCELHNETGNIWFVRTMFF
jgi:hypothetical protein